jgi:hypothetical protein
MNTPDKQSLEIIRATARGRAWMIVLIALAVILVAFFQWFVFPLLDTALQAAPDIDAVKTLRLIFPGCAILGMLPALFLVATGWKVRRCGQFPLPGAWVWQDTPVKRGKCAGRLGWLCMAAGTVSALLCAGLALYASLMLDRMAPELSVPPGVIILKEAPATRK